MTADAQTAEQPLVLETAADAGVTTLTLNRPRRFNALSSALLTELQTAFERIADDAATRVVILAAAGNGFCAGHDLKEIRAQRGEAEHRALFEQCSRLMMTINQLPQPVIAQVNGIATAAGCQLVGACDLAVAGRGARFAVNGIDQGLFCSTPAVALSRNLGRKQAMYLLLTGEFIDADAALRYGLINRVVDDDALTSSTRELAETVAAKSPLALRTGKKMFYRQLGMALDDAYRYAGAVMACNMDSDDAREGVDAFFDKRRPVWRGPS